jgi:hypothetical protein
MTQDAANTTAAQDQEILQDLENVELGKLTTSDFIQKLKSALDTKSPDFTEYFVSLLWVFGTQVGSSVKSSLNFLYGQYF